MQPLFLSKIDNFCILNQQIFKYDWQNKKRHKDIFDMGIYKPKIGFFE